MSNRSSFPNQIDVFSELYDLPPEKYQDAERLQILMKTPNKTQIQIAEMNSILVSLKDYYISTDRWNYLADCIVNMETFIKTEVDGYIDNKQNDMNQYVNNKKTEVTNFTTQKTTEVTNFTTQKTNEIIKFTTDKTTEVTNFTADKKKEVTDFVNIRENEMSDLKNNYVNIVNQKQLELAELDSRTVRYWQKWNAIKDGQVEFDIFNGGMNLSLPAEATLNIDPQNIDVIIQGVEQTPYEDFEVKKDGLYRTLLLKGNASSQIRVGTEILIRYYKNVGRLYFRHKSTHEAGGNDQITVSEPMLDENLKDKINSSVNFIIGSTTPTSPKSNTIWFDTSIK